MKPRLVLLALPLGSLLCLPAHRAEAQSCEPATVMLILDKSSSMQTGTIGGATKWSIAVDAIDTVTTAFETNLALGLMVFPNPDQCSPGAVEVDPGLSMAASIRDQLAAPPPTGGNYTPIAQTLSAAAAVPALASGEAPRYAVLITDGWQWCDPYDPNTRFDALETAEQLNAAGVTTYVVGFGDSVDALLLNRLAQAAGTSIAGCDPTGDTPTAADPCYYQANDPQDLVDALMQIAGEASEEVCDGVDNDCDGLVDDMTRPCDGECGSGTETCESGIWGSCTAVEPAPESCDGVDNDCDGETDEQEPGDVRDELCGPGLECVDGSCTPPGEPPTGDGEGDGEEEEDPVEPGGMTAGCGCRTGAGGGAGGALLLVAALALGLRRRRRDVSN